MQAGWGGLLRNSYAYIYVYFYMDVHIFRCNCCNHSQCPDPEVISLNSLSDTIFTTRYLPLWEREISGCWSCVTSRRITDNTVFFGEGSRLPLICTEKQREVRLDTQRNTGSDLTLNFRANVCTEQQLWILPRGLGPLSDPGGFYQAVNPESFCQWAWEESGWDLCFPFYPCTMCLEVFVRANCAGTPEAYSCQHTKRSPPKTLFK